MAELNGLSFEEFGDPEINTKVEQYEMAYRMQTAVPEITDLSKEPDKYYKIVWSRLFGAGNLCSELFAGKKTF